jgi:diguanylate cyclase (GGDEF)-like protein
MFARHLPPIRAALDALKRRASAMTLPAAMLVCAIGVVTTVALQTMMHDAGERARNIELAAGAPRALSEANAARAALSEYERAPNDGTLNEARLHVQVLLSRLDTLGAGIHVHLLQASPVARQRRAAALAHAERAEGAISEDAGKARAAIEDLAAAVDHLEAFAAEAQIHGANDANDASERVRKLGVGQIVATIAMLAAIVIGLILAVRQNRRLARANVAARASAARFERLANRDGLTGLANRAASRDLAAALFARARARGLRVGAMCIDVDRFKQINDTLGHRAGDALLRTVAARLSDVVANEEDAFAARIGGDEFWICRLLTDPDDHMVGFGAGVARDVGGERELDGHRVEVAISGGVACADPDGIDPEELLARADMALRNAKERGRARVSRYQDGMAESRRRRLEIEQGLQGALARGEFHLVYQPIVAAKSGAPEAIEALLRWTHPKFGFISPAEFIPIAENTGCIAAIGEWVLRRACADAATLDGLRVSVNVSAQQLLRASLADHVREALAAARLDPRRLELEITETALVRDEDRARAFVADMTAGGVEVALDDFGVGYSSLSYLRSFAFSRLKMDRSFVSDVENPVSRALARAILDIAEALDLQVTAEGVETHSQALILAAEGCDSLQGYLFAKPMPLAALREWLARARETAAA